MCEKRENGTNPERKVNAVLIHLHDLAEDILDLHQKQKYNAEGQSKMLRANTKLEKVPEAFSGACGDA